MSERWRNRVDSLWHPAITAALPAPETLPDSEDPIDHLVSKFWNGELPTPVEMKYVIELTTKVLSDEPNILELEGPITVCGDIHGQFEDMLEIFNICGLPPYTKYLFLGDYVDRGSNSIEVLVTLFVLKCMFPKKIWLLRGNHETRETTLLYGFAEECRIRYSSEVYNWFVEVFAYLPLSAIVGDRIFCVHGGISSQLERLSQISNIERPVNVYEASLVQDLLWADPNPTIRGFQKSNRGTSFIFGSDAADEFLEKFDFDLVCRSHQAVVDGYDFPFLPSRKVVTIFSAVNYFQDQQNRPAIMSVNEKLECSFKFLNQKSALPKQKPI